MADFDIDPDAVTQSINRLRAASEDFGSAWEQRKQALQASQARFGKDQVAQVFAERYLPLAEKLTARADGPAKRSATEPRPTASTNSSTNSAR